MAILTDGVHLVSDASKDELHAFAKRIGLKRTWYQHPPLHYYWHYDTMSAAVKGRSLRCGARMMHPDDMTRRMFNCGLWVPRHSSPSTWLNLPPDVWDDILLEETRGPEAKCGGFVIDTIDGRDFDCSYEYAGEVDCDDCIFNGHGRGRRDPRVPPPDDEPGDFHDDDQG